MPLSAFLSASLSASFSASLYASLSASVMGHSASAQQYATMTSLHTQSSDSTRMVTSECRHCSHRLSFGQRAVSRTSVVGLVAPRNGAVLSRSVPLPGHSMHEVPTSNYSLHDVPTSNYSLHEVPTSNYSMHEVPTANYSLHEVPTSSYSLHEVSTSNYSLHEVPTANYSVHEVPTSNYNLHEVPTSNYSLTPHPNRTRHPGVTNNSSNFRKIPNSTDGDFASEDYTYDYNIADASVDLNEILPVSLVYGVTLAIGVVGNLLVIAAVARDRRLRSITNIFLTSLASADLALLCFCVPVKCAAFFSFTWAFGYFLCKSVHYVQVVAMVCSIMTLTLMSIERNIAILFPLRSKRTFTRGRARVVVVLVWLASLLLALPILAGQRHKMVGDRFKAYWCIKEWDHPVYSILFESYMLVLLFLVPVGVMVVSYTTICLELSRGSKFRRQATMNSFAGACQGYANHVCRHEDCDRQVSCKGNCATRVLQSRNQERMDQEKMKVIRMLIVVVVLFAVCWGPILINNLLVALGILDTLHVGHLKPLRQALFVLSYLNSSLNPLVYGFMSRHFRRGFREAICACCSSNGRRGESSVRRSDTRNRLYASDYRGASNIRTGTIRLSTVIEQGAVIAADQSNGSIETGRKYGRRIWAKTESVALDLHM